MKIKVCFITPYVRGGGAERVQINVINSLSSLKYDVYFIILSNEKPPEELNSTIKVVNFNMDSAIMALGKVISLIRKLNPEYIFSTSATIAYYLPVLKLVSNCKVVVRIAVPPSEKVNVTFKSRLMKLISKITFRFVDEFIAQTHYMKSDFISHYSFLNPDRIRVVSNPISQEFLKVKSADRIPEKINLLFNNNSIVIVAAGALYSVKGFDVLIKAFALLPGEVRAKCKLLIMGEERYEIGYSQILLDFIKKLNLVDSVYLTGFVNNPYPIFKRANVFVLSSRTEGFPNVVLEALSLGTPVVATNCVDFEGIINNTNGRVVNVEDENGMAKAITEVVLKTSKPIDFNYTNFNYEEVFKWKNR